MLNIKGGENTPDADFGSTKDDLIKAILTVDDNDLLEAGTDIKIVLDINNIDDSVAPSDKQAVTGKADGYSVGQYLDINLYKYMGENREKISQTNDTIRIVIAVPDTAKNTNSESTRTYAVVRVHNGETDLLTDLDNDEATITIETDRFSTYALVYKDTASAGNNVNSDKDSNNTASSSNNDNYTDDTNKSNAPKTGDNTPVKVCTMLAMIAGLFCLILFLVNRRRNFR